MDARHARRRRGSTRRPGPRRSLLLASLAAAALLAPASPVAAQPAPASPGGPVQFSATLSALQVDHAASLMNVKYTTHNEYCKDRFVSHSTDQQMEVTSDPVVVDVVLLDAAPAGWGAQTTFLVPHGGSVEDVTAYPPADELFFAEPIFELPSHASVTRTSANPATGDLPEPMLFEDPCAGGDGSGNYSPPPQDCGLRDFQLTMALIAPAPGQLHAWTSGSDQDPAVMYTNCPSDLDMAPGQFVAEEGVTTVTRDGGDLPAADQLLDPSVPRLEVTGTADGEYRDQGFLDKTHYEWTLTLCRITGGVPAC